MLIGRPYLWGLALDGQNGVETVLRCLLAELDLTMALSGFTTLDEIDADAAPRDLARQDEVRRVAWIVTVQPVRSDLDRISHHPRQPHPAAARSPRRAE